MTEGWRIWRPAIWLAMAGIAVMLVMSTPYLGILILGGALGVGARIAQRRRQVSRSSVTTSDRRQR
jgi:hypothetical protein